MNSEWLAVRSVQLKDMWTLTRMAFTNMTGVDQQFTRMAQHPVWRLAGYVALPFYFWTAGRGYKALADGQIVGCAFVHFLADSAVVFNVNVNRAYRRRGWRGHCWPTWKRWLASGGQGGWRCKWTGITSRPGHCMRGWVSGRSIPISGAARGAPCP